jgi:NhaP-type Na+/H+ or K+/H+ antiporter
MEEVFSAEAVMLVALLLLAAGGAVLAVGRLRMPTAVGLVLAGLVLGALAKIENLSWLAEFELTPGGILFVFLPTLLFESAFNIDARRLGENLLPVFILAVPVLLLSVVTGGAILDGLVQFVVVVTGGLAFGAGAGYLMAQLVGKIHNDRLVEPTMTLALMGDSVRHASVWADTDMETLTIKEDVFNELLGSLPGMAARITEAQSHYVGLGRGGGREESGAD